MNKPEKRTPEQLLNMVIGQLEGVKKMLAGNQDCLNVLIQLKAAKSAMDNATANILAENIKDCAASNKLSDKKKIASLLQELVKSS